jgi:hypothetical protein
MLARMKNLETRPALILALAVLAVTLSFAAFTQHAWEDYWITFRASQNLATGHGFVFTPGERLHTYTSPIGALVPAFFCWITNNQSDVLTLWLFRLASTTALAAGLVLIYSLLKTLQLRTFSCWLVLALIGLDAKTVDFSINGMETGLLIFFLALSLHGLLVEGPRQFLRLGIGWGGLMWSRPDSCIYIAVLALGAFIFLARKQPGKPVAWLKLCLAAGIICTLLYLPWLIWSAWYYGSPIPHTIVAKATNKPPIHLIDLLKFPLKLSESSVAYNFMPAYAVAGGWPQSLFAACNVMSLVAVLAWPVFILRPHTRLFSLACFLANFYLTCILRFYSPWYLPAAAILGYLTLGLLFDELLGGALRLKERGKMAFSPALLKALALVLVLGQLAVTLSVAWEVKQQQRIIETGERKPIGLWLRAHAASPHDTVMLEPLGYIGYYSGLKMYDYPGLSSKEMVEIRKRYGRGRDNQVYRELRPDWLVLRPYEVAGSMLVEAEGLEKYYEEVQVYDVSDQIDAVTWLPGRGYLLHDASFIIFHRKPEPATNSVIQTP